MQTLKRLSLIELFIALLTSWVVYIWMLLLGLRLTGLMLGHAALLLVVFGPGVVLTAVFALIELRLLRRSS
ncbi:hypothetical protein [Lichenicoccus sp.]|uniref:hypothetical protein n=1 Tax=Lichenicoccus sp. TaxID=2781899 RepID=UPI003D0B7CE5